MIEEKEAKALLKEGERIDDLQRNGFGIIQNPNKFCFGMDAVLLSDFAKVKPGEKVLDFCSGNGIIPILLAAKTKAGQISGLEINPQSVDLFERSIVLNDLSERVSVCCGDLKDTAEFFKNDSMDVVTANPPYMIDNHGIQNPEDEKAIARHELKMSLEDLVAASAKVLKTNGRCYYVHRPFRMVELFTLMSKYGIEPKTMRLVYPFVDKEPNMVLVEGIKGGKSRLTVEKPLIVYEKQGVYTQEIMEIYGY